MNRSKNHRYRRSTTASELVRLLSVAIVLGGTTALSLSRAIHDVKQDIDEDASTYFPEYPPEISTSTGQQKPGEQYVTIKSSPQGGILNVERGQRVELTCEVDGSPAPRIHWIREENGAREVKNLAMESVVDSHYVSIAREVSKLVIDNVTPDDSGTIFCVGVTGNKLASSEPVILNVIEGGKKDYMLHDEIGRMEKPIITRHRSFYIAEKGSTVELPCEAIGYPRPHVRWYNSTNVELQAPDYIIQENGQLVIPNLRWENMDSYKCVVTSGKSTSTAETFLYPAAK